MLKGQFGVVIKWLVNLEMNWTSIATLSHLKVAKSQVLKILHTLWRQSVTYHYVNQRVDGMFSIKFAGPVNSSTIISPKFSPVLAWKTMEKTMENFHGSSKYDAKHCA